jgi:hypothetical protein
MWLCVAQQTDTNIAGNLLPPASVFPEEGGLSNITICNGCQVTFCFHDSSLLGYGTVTGWVFSDILIKTAWPRRQRHCSLPKYQELLTQQHTISSRKLWILSKSAVTTAQFCWSWSAWKLFLCGLFNDTYSWNYILLNGWMDSEGQKCHQLIHLAWWTWKENSVTHAFYVLYECCWWLGRNALNEACQTGSPFKFFWQCIEHFKTNY